MPDTPSLSRAAGKKLRPQSPSTPEVFERIGAGKHRAEKFLKGCQFTVKDWKRPIDT